MSKIPNTSGSNALSRPSGRASFLLANGKQKLKITDRDRACLRFLAEQYGVPLKILRWVISRFGTSELVSDRAARQQLLRWLTLGLVQRVVVGGATWITPSRAGYRLAGLDLPLWAAPVTRLEHTRQCAAVRLWWESSRTRLQSQGRWVGERQLFSERANNLWHVPDAELRRTEQRLSWAIEVELTPKTPRRYRDEVLGRLSPNTAGVIYLCRPDVIDRVRRGVERAAVGLGAPPIHFRELPSLEAVKFEGNQS